MNTPALIDRALETSVVGSFSRVGYDVRRRLFHWAALPPMSGTVVITGATSGIGLESAMTLARLGAAVHFVARDDTRARRAREKILAVSTSGEVEYYLADMADLGAVRDVAAALTKRLDRLDVLIHNAGAIAPTLTYAHGGIEVTLAAQLLGPFLMTTSLLPLLSAAAPGRVISVSSGGMYTQRFDLAQLTTAPEPYDGVATYARVKRAQVVLTHEWARRVSPASVLFAAMHPGWVNTPGVVTSLPTFHTIMGPLLRTPAQGADTVVWLADDADLAGHDGQFWLDRGVRSEYKLARTRPLDVAADQARLWQWCEEHS